MSKRNRIFAKAVAMLLCIAMMLANNWGFLPKVVTEVKAAELDVATFDIDEDAKAMKKAGLTAAVLYEQLFDINNKVELNLDISKDEITKLEQDYEDGWDCNKSPMYRRADLYITITTSTTKYTYKIKEVGVKMKGNTSRTDFYNKDQDKIYNNIHFKVSFEETFTEEEYYGTDVTTWENDSVDEAGNPYSAAKEAREDRTFAGMSKLEMKWSKCEDTTYVREYYINEMYRSFGLMAARTNVSSLKFYNNNMGVYTIYEPIDKKMLKRDEYGLSKTARTGDLFKCSAGADFSRVGSDNMGVETEGKNGSGFFPIYEKRTNKDVAGSEALTKLVNALNDKNVTKEQLEELIDVDAFVKFAALSYFTGNPDDIRNNSNNYFMFFNGETGKVYFLPYDMDRCFGTTIHWNPSGDCGTSISPFSTKTTSGATVSKLFSLTVSSKGFFVEEYKKALNDVMNSEWMTPEKYDSIYQIAYNNYKDVPATCSLKNKLAFDNTTDGGLQDYGKTNHNASVATFMEAIKSNCKPYIDGTYVEPPKNVYLRGEMNGWSCNENYLFRYNSADKTYYYDWKLSDTPAFKVYDEEKDSWIGFAALENLINVKCKQDGSDGNIRCTESGQTFRILYNDATGKISFACNNHSYELKSKTASTYTKKGKEVYACSKCGFEYTKELALLPRTSLTNAKVSGIVAKNYTGKALTQSGLKVIVGSKTLSLNKDYKVTYSNNTKLGKAKVVITGINGYKGSLTKYFKIKVYKGKTYTVNGMKYKVTNASTTGTGTVTLAGTTKSKSSLKTLTVGSTVAIGGKSFKITSVGASAFKGFTALTSVTIGANVKTIGASAFYGCSKLAGMKITSKVLTSVGSSAIKGTKSTLKISVPSTKLTAYKKLFKSTTGFKSKTMKIVKY